MNCAKCGAVIPEGKNFCVECGEHLPDKTETPEVRKCAKCGAVIPEGKNFCVECGERLPDKTETAEARSPGKVKPAKETGKTAGKGWPVWIMYVIACISVITVILTFLVLEFVEFPPLQYTSNQSLQIIGFGAALLPLILIPFFSWKGRIIGIVAFLAGSSLTALTFFWASKFCLERYLESMSYGHQAECDGDRIHFWDRGSGYGSANTRQDQLVMDYYYEFGKMKLAPKNTAAKLWSCWFLKSDESKYIDAETFSRSFSDFSQKYISVHYKEHIRSEYHPEHPGKYTMDAFVSSVKTRDRIGFLMCFSPDDREKIIRNLADAFRSSSRAKAVRDDLIDAMEGIDVMLEDSEALLEEIDLSKYCFCIDGRAGEKRYCIDPKVMKYFSLD